MRLYGSFGIVIGSNASICVLMGPYKSLSVLMCLYVFLLFLTRPYGSL